MPHEHAMAEPCDRCGRETTHSVSLEISAGGSDAKAVYSREPLRVAVCRICGSETVTRISRVRS